MMVTLPQCHYSEDQALSCFLLPKKHVLKLLLAKETGTHSLIQNQMASRYSNFPVSLLSRQIMGQVFFFFFFFSVWMWTVILCFDSSAGSTSAYVFFLFFFQARNNKSLWSCGADNLSQSQTLEAILQSLCSVIWPASGADTVKTRAGFAKDETLTKCFSDGNERFLQNWNLSRIYCRPRAVSLPSRTCTRSCYLTFLRSLRD